MNVVHNGLKLIHFILENSVEDINPNSKILTLSLQDKVHKAAIHKI